MGRLRQHGRRFRASNAEISAIAESAGPIPASVERSACVLVSFDPAAGERPRSDERRPSPATPDGIARALHDLAEAGAHEAILVLDPINEASSQAVRRRAGRARRLSAHQPAGRLIVWPPSTTITWPVT